MIKDFAGKETAKVFRGGHTGKFPSAILERAREQLFILAAAVSLNDLRIPPGNHLEALKGDRKG
jgi:proteic killer suppression protein